MTKIKNRAHNLTTAFALPLLGWNRSMYKPHLIDAYIRHDGIEQFEDGHIFVLLKWADEERYKKIDETLIAHPTHVTSYDVDTGGQYVMHVFKVRDSMLLDYNKFRSGKYSQMSVGAKKSITDSAKLGGTTAQILNKGMALKEAMEHKVGQSLDSSAEVWPCIEDVHTVVKEVFSEDVLSDIINN